MPPLTSLSNEIGTTMTDLARLQQTLAKHFPHATVADIGIAARALLRELRVTP